MPRNKQKQNQSENSSEEQKPIEDSIFDLVVTRSYVRKISHEAHGAIKFETSDIGSSRTARILDPEKAKAASEFLYNECVREVDEAVKAFDAAVLDSIEQSVPDQKELPKRKKEKTAMDDLEMTQEEIKEIAPIINKMAVANTKEELEAVGGEIASQQETLSKTQLDYLRAKFNKKASILK